MENSNSQNLSGVVVEEAKDAPPATLLPRPVSLTVATGASAVDIASAMDVTNTNFTYGLGEGKSTHLIAARPGPLLSVQTGPGLDIAPRSGRAVTAAPVRAQPARQGEKKEKEQKHAPVAQSGKSGNQSNKTGARPGQAVPKAQAGSQQRSWAPSGKAGVKRGAVPAPSESSGSSGRRKPGKRERARARRTATDRAVDGDGESSPMAASAAGGGRVIDPPPGRPATYVGPKQVVEQQSVVKPPEQIGRRHVQVFATLEAEILERLKRDFPQFEITDMKSQRRQHPWAHAERQLAEQVALDILGEVVRPDQWILDVGGNPVRHMTQKRKRVWSACPIRFPHDAARIAGYTAKNAQNFCTHRAEVCQCQTFRGVLMVHSIYYLKPEVVLQFVDKYLRVVSVAHKFPDMLGAMFNGEVKYNQWTGSISCYAAGNSTAYNHPNPMWLEDGYFTDGKTAMAWTTQLVGEASYITTFSPAPPGLHHELKALDLDEVVRDPQYYGTVDFGFKPGSSRPFALFEQRTVIVSSVWAIHDWVVFGYNTEHNVVVAKGLVSELRGHAAFHARDAHLVTYLTKMARARLEELNMPGHLVPESVVWAVALAMRVSPSEEAAIEDSLGNPERYARVNALLRGETTKRVPNWVWLIVAAIGTTAAGIWLSRKGHPMMGNVAAIVADAASNGDASKSASQAQVVEQASDTGKQAAQAVRDNARGFIERVKAAGTSYIAHIRALAARFQRWALERSAAADARVHDVARDYVPGLMLPAGLSAAVGSVSVWYGEWSEVARSLVRTAADGLPQLAGLAGLIGARLAGLIPGNGPVFRAADVASIVLEELIKRVSPQWAVALPMFEATVVGVMATRRPGANTLSAGLERALGTMVRLNVHFIATTLPLWQGVLFHLAYNYFVSSPWRAHLLAHLGQVKDAVAQDWQPEAVLVEKPYSALLQGEWSKHTPVVKVVGHDAVAPLKTLAEGAQIRPPVEPKINTGQVKDHAYGLYVPFRVPVVSASTTSNELLSLQNRVCTAVPLPEQDAWDQLADEQRRWRGESWMYRRPSDLRSPIGEGDFEAWVTRFPASQRIVLRRALEAADWTRRGIRRASRRKMFIKAEHLDKSRAESVVDYAPRAIQATSDEANATLGPPMWAWCKRLRDVWNSESPIFYTAGASCERIGSWLETAVWRCVSAGHEPGFLEDDGTLWDAHVSEEAMRCEQREYAASRMSKPALRVIRAGNRTVGRTASGVAYQCRGGRKSGDPHTSGGNSYINGVTHFHIAMRAVIALGRHLNVPVSIAVMGDDMLMVAPLWFLRRIDWATEMRRFGFTQKPVIRDLNQLPLVEFCSCLFWPTSRGLVLGCKPGRLLYKSGWSITRQRRPLEWLRGVALGLADDVAHVPFAHQWVARILQLTAGTRSRPIVNEYRPHVGRRHECAGSPVLGWTTSGFVSYRYGLDYDCVQQFASLLAGVTMLPCAVNSAILSVLILRDT